MKFFQWLLKQKKEIQNLCKRSGLFDESLLGWLWDHFVLFVLFAFLVFLVFLLVGMVGFFIYAAVTGKDLRTPEEVKWDDEKTVVQTGSSLTALCFKCDGHQYLLLDHPTEFNKEVVHDPDCPCFEEKLKKLLDAALNVEKDKKDKKDKSEPAEDE